MSLGETLRTAREAKGLSLEDIKNSTQMLTRQIAEMEEDNFTSFLAPIYAKGFIRLYARAVGLDPEPLVKEFMANPPKTGGGPAPVKSVAPPPPRTPAAAPAPAPAPAVPAAAAAPAAESDAAAPADGSQDLFSFRSQPAPAAPAAPTAPAADGPAAGPVVVSNRTAVPRKVAVSAPLDFEKRVAPAAMPAKKIAPVAPGEPVPESPLPPRGEGARVLARPEFVPPPATKKLPEPESVAAQSAFAAPGRPIAPEPLPLEGAAFRFPGPAPVLSPLPGTDVPAPAAPRPAPVRPRRSLFAAAAEAAAPAPAREEEIVAAAPTPPPAPAPVREERLFAETSAAPRRAARREEARPDAPNAASLFFTNLGAALRKKRARCAAAWRERRGLRTGAWSALGLAAVALVAALGVSLFAGPKAERPDGEVRAADTGVAAVGSPDRRSAPPVPAAADVEPPEPIVKVLPPPASWAK